MAWYRFYYQKYAELKKKLYIVSHCHFLHCCRKGDLAEAMILANNVDIDIHYQNDFAFFQACLNGHLHVAKWLYSFGGIDIHFNNDETFRWCCVKGYLNMVKWFYSLGGINMPNYKVGDVPYNVYKWLCSLEHSPPLKNINDFSCNSIINYVSESDSESNTQSGFLCDPYIDSD